MKRDVIHYLELELFQGYSMKRILIILLVNILICTGCGSAVSTIDFQEQKENTEKPAELSTDIQKESEVQNFPEEREISEEFTSLLETVESDKESKDATASDEGSEDTDRADITMEGVLEKREGITNDNIDLETQKFYEITDGSTGKRVTINESQQLECMEALLENMTIQKEESIQSDAEKTVGYLYCIRVLDENGNVSQTITLRGSQVKIDSQYYTVESMEDLVAYLDGLYE